MLDEKKITEFVEGYTDSVESQKRIARFMKQVMACEKEIGHDLAQFSKDDYSQMFTEYEWVVSGNFEANRSYLNAYIKNERAKGEVYKFNIMDFTIDDIDPSVLYNWKFFKDTNEFVSFLNKYFKDASMMRMQALYVMYWIGISRSESVDVRRNDIDKENKIVFGHTNVDPKLIEVLLKCHAVTEFDTNGKHFDLIPSDYIMKRTAQNESIDGKDNLTTRSLTKMAIKANKVLEESGSNRQMSQQALTLNGQFIKVYNYQTEHRGELLGSDFKAEKEILKRLFDGKTITNNIYRQFFRKYNAWKKFFYNE